MVFEKKEELNSDQFHRNFSSSQILTAIQALRKFEHENLTDLVWIHTTTTDGHYSAKDTSKLIFPLNSQRRISLRS